MKLQKSSLQLDKNMAARLFFAWSMLAAADDQDLHNINAGDAARRRAASDPIRDLTETEFRARYRLPKKAFRRLCKELKHKTSLKSSQRVSLEQKVYTALLFYASGSYQRSVGMAQNVSQKTCSRYIEEVTQALTDRSMVNKYIRFPHTPVERQAVCEQFFRDYGIPGVVGCIDCSHFKLVTPPREVEHMYFSRKNYHSLNVQMVCDSKCRILSVNTKFGGANHDSFIWENSELCQYMKTVHNHGEMVWLLGDSGYSQRPWLMTPYPNPTAGSTEAKYNERHIKARVKIENTFGRLKNRWRCLCKDRTLHYKPTKCAKIILANCVLHNLGLDYTLNDADFEIGHQDSNVNVGPFSRHVMPDGDYDGQGMPEEEDPSAVTDLIRGRAARDQLARRIVQ